MAIKQMILDLDQEMVKVYDEYIALHKEFDKYRGHVIQESELEPLNKVLTEIQDKFNELFHAYNFISYRYQSTCNAVTSYNEFIDSLKKAGASENKGKPNDNSGSEPISVQ